MPNNAPAALQAALAGILHDGKLCPTSLPGTDLRLWLIDERNMHRPFTDDEVRRIMQEPPYWSFCWASGLVLAQWLQANPACVRGKTVLDFGAGSGVAALAAARAGAARVVACDIDPLALQACRANAQLNGLPLHYSANFFAEAEMFDVVLVADVLYDRANLPLLDAFLARGKTVLLADSRVRNFSHPRYQRIGLYDASTWPDLDESPEFRRVSLYSSAG